MHDLQPFHKYQFVCREYLRGKQSEVLQYEVRENIEKREEEKNYNWKERFQFRFFLFVFLPLCWTFKRYFCRTSVTKFTKFNTNWICIQFNGNSKSLRKERGETSWKPWNVSYRTPFKVCMHWTRKPLFCGWWNWFIMNSYCDVREDKVTHCP